MADQDHLDIVKKGAAAWNEWRRANHGLTPDLTGASLSGYQLGNLRLANVDLSLSTLKKTNLRGSDFWRTDLNLSDLSGADVSRSYFGRSHLHAARFCGADMSATRFVGTDLSGADLSHAKIFSAHFIDSDLSGADFTNAWIKETAFANVDLSHCKGLDKVKFIGPSSLGIDSLYRSRGMIPVEFLRGCGVPEEFIRIIPNLHFESPLHFSCFISHSSMDRIFCDQLFGDLRANGVRCWYFPDDHASGSSQWELKDKSVHIYDKLLVICSKHSLRDKGVIDEIETALESEKSDARSVLHCITRDDFLANEWEHPGKTRVSEAVSADFRHWENPESYARGLGKLIAALKRA